MLCKHAYIHCTCTCTITAITIIFLQFHEATKRWYEFITVGGEGVVGEISYGVVVEAEIVIDSLVDGVGIASKAVVTQVEQTEGLTVKCVSFKGLYSVL